MIDEKLSTVPNEKYAKFFAQFAEIASLETAHWKIPHLIGFFCQRYYDKYAIGYQFKFNTPTPPKCFEVWQMKKLGSILSTDPTILQNYIDWVFEKKVPELKRRFTSISFLTRESLVNEFKWKVLTSSKNELHLDRTTPLPPVYQEVLAEALYLTPYTYGDLSFLYRAYQTCNVFENEEFVRMEKMFSKLAAAGFDLQLLNKVV
jgi:hypothetical protein